MIDFAAVVADTQRPPSVGLPPLHRRPCACSPLQPTSAALAFLPPIPGTFPPAFVCHNSQAVSALQCDLLLNYIFRPVDLSHFNDTHQPTAAATFWPNL